MHEFLLHASLPSSRQSQVLSILAGLAAMQPAPLHEEIRLYRPNRSPESSRSVQVGAVQGVSVPKSQSQMQAAMAGDLYYLRVVKELRDGARPFGKIMDQGTGDGLNGKIGEDEKSESMDVDPQPQTESSQPSEPHAKDSPTSAHSSLSILQFRDLPEPTRQKDRAVTTRFIADVPITSGSPSAFMKALDYSPVTVYYTDGHRLTYNNIALHLYRVFVPASLPPADLLISEIDIKEGDLKPLDKSGGFLLQASVRVQDGSKVETMTRGATELLALRETLKGVIGLEMVERLALDTRVR